METNAIIFLTCSVTFVVTLVSWCYYKVLTTPRDGE
ncbi:MAG: hypothetical protein ACI8PQ_002034 [Planctomycetota bacterium]|jgi:hypothetical protein